MKIEAPPIHGADEIVVETVTAKSQVAQSYRSGCALAATRQAAQYPELTRGKQGGDMFLNAGRGSPAIGSVHDRPSNYDVISTISESFFDISGTFLVVRFWPFIVIYRSNAWSHDQEVFAETFSEQRRFQARRDHAIAAEL